MASFPQKRLRRRRRTESIRTLTRETALLRADFIYPLFVVEEQTGAGPIASMPGISRLTLQQLPREVESLRELGLYSVILFGLPGKKDQRGVCATHEKGIVPEAVRAIKAVSSDLVVMTDVCLCQYTEHGHCGVITDHQIDNDETLELLGAMAVAHARAGADVVAPSGMMDGMVRSIRSALDDSGFGETAILSYAAKYASGFYGPFREAADSAPQFGDRRSYQMDPGNAREALAEVALDIAEGADFVMVKPALPYLDVVHRVRTSHPEMPLAAYQVSGEYSMLKAAAINGWLDERRVVMESLTAIKRAGADMILTYFAKQAAGWLED